MLSAQTVMMRVDGALRKMCSGYLSSGNGQWLIDTYNFGTIDLNPLSVNVNIAY